MSAVADNRKVAPGPAPDARRRLIEERKKNSLAWRLIHLLGSLRLALFVLAAIAITIAVATFYESALGTKAAQTIYKGPWFLFLLGVLCINLFAVTLTRWPWQRKHAGFIITHYGIITLLIGAVVGSKFGFEGNVTLHKGAPPISRITTSRSVLQVESPKDGALYLMPFDAELARPSDKRPRVLNIPDSDTRLVADGFSDNLIREERLAASDEAGAGPGIVLELTSSAMGQHIRMPLVLRADGGVEKDFFGLARVALLPELPDRKPADVRETQMIFAKFSPVVQADGSAATGVSFRLSEDGSKLTAVAPDGSSATYSRAEIVGKPIRVGPASAEVRNYWPDFKLENGVPTSISPLPNNPAVLVQVEGPGRPSADTPAQPMLEMAPGKSGIDYQLSRGGVVYAGGSAATGGSISLGWADWTATVAEFLPTARIVEEVKPGPDDETGVPGFHAKLRAPDGREGPAKWIESGSISTLADDRTVVRLGYGLESKPVDFSIRLKDFEVPRFEGTETPANFIATVEFRDRKTGQTREGVAKMNHPASWPGDLFANLTGVNYKFSQAEWNPKDLGETTLQVLYDPGWLLKWVGSLAICAGIAMLFYLRPAKGRKS